MPVARGGGKYTISQYEDKAITSAEELMKICEMIKWAYPAAFKSDAEWTRWLSLLVARMIANGFTQARALDAVTNMIDNVQTFAQINISSIIQFDRTTNLVDYNTMCTMVYRKEAHSTSDFIPHRFPNGKILYEQRV